MNRSLRYGKYKDQPLSNVPEDYLQWLKRENLETIRFIDEELQRREMAELAEGTWVEKLIKAGYRSLMKAHHPDTGGTDGDAQQINAAYENLMRRT